MKFLASIFGLKKVKRFQRKTIKEYQNDLLLLQGRDQFKKLLKLGQMPVAFL